MAKIVLTPGNEGPVNEGERRVLAYLETALPDHFTIYPNLQVAVGQAGLAECDLIVIGPDCMWLIEVKDFANKLVVTEQQFIVNDESRNHAVHQTRSKAQKIKSRLSIDPALVPLWIQPLVVLARRPATLDISQTMKNHVMLMERAAAIISDPTLIDLQKDRFSELMRNKVRTRLALDGSTKIARPVYGSYRTDELLSNSSDREWWRAHQEVMGTPVLLEVVKVSPLLAPDEQARRRNEAYRAAKVRPRTGDHPLLVTPETAFNADDGSVVVVHPNIGDLTLEDVIADVVEKPDSYKREIVNRISAAVQYCHNMQVVHRTIGPSSIFITGQSKAKLGGFSRASFVGVAGATVSPADWGALGGQFWIAPEHYAGAVGPEADLFALGRLVEYLWPDAVPADLAPLVARLLAEEPDERSCTAKELADATGGNAAAPAPKKKALVEFAPDALLENRYRVVEQVGFGASGTVWRAVDELAAKDVVLKVYESLDAGEAVMREYNALLDLHHPNIVKVRGAATIEGRWVLISEYLDGPTLRAAMPPAAEPTTEDGAVTVALRLLDALRSIHPDVPRILELQALTSRSDADEAELERLQASGLVHRDVKPENVILAAPDRPVLIDFGLAASGLQGEAGGSREYCPAGVAGDGVDPDRDLFAVGVMIHELLTGKHPYTDADPVAGEVDIDASLSPALAAVVARACSPRFDERFRCAEHFIDELVALGFADVPFETPSPAGLELMKAIKQALFEQRWDDAAQLCPAAWVTVAAKIERLRQINQHVRVTPPLITVDGFSLRFLEERRFDFATDPGRVERGPGVIRTYLVEGPAGEMLEVLDFIAQDGGRWITGGNSFDTPLPLSRLSQGLRIGSKSLEDRLLIELRQARLRPKLWSNAYKASKDELDAGSGVDVERVLVDHGALAIGTRESIIGDTSRQKTYMAMTVSPSNSDAPAIAFFLTRVMPLVRGVTALSADED